MRAPFVTLVAMPPEEDDPLSPDPSTRPLDPTLHEQNWGDLHRRLLVHGLRRLPKDPGLAGDLASQTLLLVLDPRTSRYDHEAHPDLLYYLGSVFNGLLANKRRAAATRNERQVVSKKMARRVAKVSDGSKTVEALMVEDDQTKEDEARAQRLLANLLAKLADDPRAVRLVELVMQGIEKAADQAAETGEPIEEIRNTRKRIARAREAVLAEENEKDQ